MDNLMYNWDKINQENIKYKIEIFVWKNNEKKKNKWKVSVEDWRTQIKYKKLS